MAKVLLVTDVPFWHCMRGNHQRIHQLTQYLAQSVELTVLYVGFETPPTSSGDIRYLSTTPYSGPRAWFQKTFNSLPNLLRNLLVGFLNRQGYSRGIDSFKSESVYTKVKSLLASSEYGTLVVEYVWHAYLAEAAPQGVLKVLDTHDVFHLRCSSYAQYQLTPDKTVTEAEELEAFRKFDHLLAIQPTEKDYLDAKVPGKSLLVMHPPSAIPVNYSERSASVSPNGKLKIAYFSAYADANVQALQWFLEHVWDQALTKGFELHVFGGICEGISLSKPSVFLKGRVGKVSEVYEFADIVINPQQVGSGLKIKTVEALAHGVPLVTSSVGAQGLEKEANKIYLLADDAATFKAQIHLLKDPEMRLSISERAAQFSHSYLTPSACFGELQTLIEQHG